MKGSDRLLRSAEQIIRPVSWATLPLLIALPLLRNAGLWSAPGWVTAWLMPILTGAAVGYLTNFIAIEMLFKPYRRTDRHWLRYATLGIWRQGLIPANKDRIGRVLGEEIPRNLIDPDEIATEIGKAATELFENESLLLRLRDVATRFLQRYSERISEFIAPHVEEALRAGLRDNLTTENLRRLWDEVAAGYLNAPENREKLASAIIDELRKRSPELASLLRDNLRSGVRDYLREKLRLLPRILVPADLAAGLVDYLDWDHIERQISEKLGEEPTQELIREEVLRFTMRVRDYLHSPKAQEHLRELLTRGSAKLEEILHDYLQEKLPELADQTLRSPELWEMLRNQVLPALRKGVGSYLRGEGKAVLIARLNLPHRIEASVAAQDVTEFHRMILAIADEHLVAIQVLGYVLGAVAGVLLAATAL
ncbi:DUF445 family protein [Victivallis sp.]|mgnify:FL=1|uniref:DUF445 family protein n=1 Tax=Victivallis sp. TaxID=2049020 RepID=UPI003A8D043B